MLGYLCISASWAVLHPLILIVLIVLIRAFYLAVTARFGLNRGIEASRRSISLTRSACAGAVSTETTLALRTSVAVALIAALALRTVALITALALRTIALIAALALRSVTLVAALTLRSVALITALALRSSIAVALIALALWSSVAVTLIAALALRSSVTVALITLALRSCLTVALIASLALRSCLAVCRCTAGILSALAGLALRTAGLSSCRSAALCLLRCTRRCSRGLLSLDLTLRASCALRPCSRILGTLRRPLLGILRTVYRRDLLLWSFSLCCARRLLCGTSLACCLCRRSLRCRLLCRRRMACRRSCVIRRRSSAARGTCTLSAHGALYYIDLLIIYT